jgi:iron complex outermembrane receptor protein
LRIAESTLATVGLDYQTNQHSIRFSRNEPAMPYENMARTEDANFRNVGVFGELRHDLSSDQRVIAGLRYDWWRAQDQRSSVNVGMMSAPNPTAGEIREDSAPGGFGRYEQDFGFGTTTVYAGLGYSERMPDYWELISKESADSVSAFDTQSEKTTQLDAGMLYAMDRWTGSLSAFYNRIDDFILIESNYTKPAGMMGTRSTSITRNIDAMTWGLEAGLGYALTGAWTVDGSIAYVRGDNETDDLPLAQLPPLEGRISLDFDNDEWIFGALLRLVAAQDRVAIDQGNIVGQDLGPTAGFGVFSLNGGWRPRDGVLIAAGVDNLFDKTYAEHISRAGASVAGFEQTTRVNEPGRTLWLKANLALD